MVLQFPELTPPTYLAPHPGGMEKSREADGGVDGGWEAEGGTEDFMLYLTVLSKIIAPKDVHMLKLGTCEYVSLHGKRDFADGTKLNTLRWGSILDNPGGPLATIRVFLRERRRQAGQRQWSEM